jgi:CheY-like chemotaxis protein/two-component sensor histidine kinase
VDDLLDVSRVTGREIELHREPVTLGRIVSEACESAGTTIAAARHVLRVDVPEDPIWLHADPARLRRVLGSLLDNSAKYTPRGGEIVVEARVEGGTAVVGVRDTGIGIPAEALPTVFDVLHEAAHTARSPRGLHIGLALVKQFVELHGGTIAARSDGEGLGAAFEIRLPVAPDGRRPAERTAPEQAPAAAKRLKVLVVDDNADLVEVLAAMVTALGHDARKALDGRTAVSAARHYRPDVVLLDLGLPVMGGIEVARELRRLPDTADARLVALTGWGQAEDRRQTREAGFDDHLVKPTDPGALERLLAEAAQACSGSRLPAPGSRLADDQGISP